jgi:hypothetical protein
MDPDWLGPGGPPLKVHDLYAEVILERVEAKAGLG